MMGICACATFGCRDRPGYRMASGLSVRLLDAQDSLGKEPYLAVASAGGLRRSGRNNSIFLAAALDVAALRAAVPQLLRREKLVFWAPAAKTVAARMQERIGSLVIEVRLHESNLRGRFLCKHEYVQYIGLDQRCFYGTLRCT